LNKMSTPSDRRLCQKITYGTLRYYPSLKNTLRDFLKKPITQKNQTLEIVICSAIYQLIVLKLPPHAIINETVALVKVIDFEWAKNFVNGVLRNLSRAENLCLNTDENDDHPAWLAEKIHQAYPEYSVTIFKANHSSANIMLRVRKKSRDDYLHQLHANDIEAEAHIDNKETIILTKPTSITDLPGFTAGEITIQDANAQLAANLLGLKSGMKVLDACAAPGGKTAHIADKAEYLDITAIDESPARITTMENTFTRLGTKATIITAKVENTASWFDNKLFDRILLDAPCSATGIIRKHPDILFHRRKTDIHKLTQLQAQLLTTSWQMLKSGGRLLYVTCSILPEENIGQITTFLAKTPNAVIRPLGHNRAISNQLGTLQFLPDSHGDGFFYANIEKKSA
ncbi:MAG: 16S rRNA (cytosine(967)-C(5))-methyltransferase RsmB, partial [Ostreibacterium sp.]